MAVIGERQITSGNGRNPSGQESWIWKVFGSEISFGSESIIFTFVKVWHFLPGMKSDHGFPITTLCNILPSSEIR